LLAGPSPKTASADSKLTVFCLDLDGFKGVNDRLGHAAGDAVFRAWTENLENNPMQSRTGLGSQHLCCAASGYFDR